MFKAKRVLNNVSLAASAIVMSVGLLSSHELRADFTSGGGGSECDRCQIKDPYGKVVFSCRKLEKESCSKTSGMFTVSCADSKAC